MSEPYHDDGVHRAGDVVILSIVNACENSKAKGKRRPAILIHRENGHWAVMGLTTNPEFRDSTPRVPVPHPDAVGLHGPGFLWGDRLTRVSALDVDQTIGLLDSALAEVVIAEARLTSEDAAFLRRVAKEAP